MSKKWQSRRPIQSKSSRYNSRLWSNNSKWSTRTLYSIKLPCLMWFRPVLPVSILIWLSQCQRSSIQAASQHLQSKRQKSSKLQISLHNKRQPNLKRRPSLSIDLREVLPAQVAPHPASQWTITCSSARKANRQTRSRHQSKQTQNSQPYSGLQTTTIKLW